MDVPNEILTFGFGIVSKNGQNVTRKKRPKPFIEMSAPKYLTGSKKGDKIDPKVGSEACQF